MDTSENYQYSQYETAAEFDSRMKMYSTGQQSAGMMAQQQSGMIPQQSGMSQQSAMSMMPPQSNMSHQSGMMSQQHGMMPQQPAPWGMPQHSNMPQGPDTWRPPPSGTIPAGSSSGNMLQQGNVSMDQQSNAGPMSQQSGQFGTAPNSYSSQYNSGMQHFGESMPDQPLANYSQSGQEMYQYGRGGQQGYDYHEQEQPGRFQQQGSSSSGYQPDDSSMYPQSGSTMNQERNTAYQQSDQTSSYGQSYSSFQPGNNNTMNQQRNNSMCQRDGNSSMNQPGNGSMNHPGNNMAYQGNSSITNQQENFSWSCPGGDRSMNQPAYGTGNYEGNMNQRNTASYQPTGTGNSSMNQSGYNTSMNQSAYDSSVNQSGYSHSMNHSGYNSSWNQPGYNSSKNQSGYSSSANQSGYNSSKNQSGYNSSKNQSGYNSSLEQSGYNRSMNQPSYNSQNQPFSTNQGGGNTASSQPEKASLNWRGNNNAANQSGNPPNQQVTGNAGNRNMNQLNSPSFQRQMPPPCSPKTRGTAGVGDQLNEFYAAIETSATEQDEAGCAPEGSPGDGQQSSNVPSSTPCSAELKQSIGQKLHEISSQMAANKGNMSQHEQPGFSQESESSTASQLGADTQCANEFADDDTDYCKLCNVYFTSAPMYAYHVRGLAHTQRMMAVCAGIDRKPAERPYILSGKSFTQTSSSTPQEKVTVQKPQGATTTQAQEKPIENLAVGTVRLSRGKYYCKICKVTVHAWSERLLWRHYKGKKHMQALQEVAEGKIVVDEKDQGPPDPNVLKAAKLVEMVLPEEETSDFGDLLYELHPDEPIAGLGFFVETVSDGERLVRCELCSTKSNPLQQINHVIGNKHRLRYLKLRDRERYYQIDMDRKGSELKEVLREIYRDLEKTEGRGTARYRGPPRPGERPREQFPGRDAAHLKRPKRIVESKLQAAVDSLKDTLMEDFHRRNIEPETAARMLESRMDLLAEYEKRQVPFAIARERVIQEEERYNLLLEFERQSLPFEEAEQRMDHRLEIKRMLEEEGLDSEEAQRKVLDDEVIQDFQREFARLGLPREQAEKQAEKRLWMLEHLHFEGLSPEDASQKVIRMEEELIRSLQQMQEESGREKGSRESQTARWMLAGEELEKYILYSYRQLGLSAEQAEAHIRVGLEALDGYRKQKLAPEEAKCRVLVIDLPIPRKQEERPPDEMETDSAPDPGSQADIENRLQQFKSKLDSVLQSNSNNSKERELQESKADEEKHMEDYDQQSRTEIQSLLSDMLKMKIPADEAKKRLAALHKQLEKLRESLSPPRKSHKSTAKPNTSEESVEPGKEMSSGKRKSVGESQSGKEGLNSEQVSSAGEAQTEKSSNQPAVVTDLKDGEQSAESAEVQNKSCSAEGSKDSSSSVPERKKQLTAKDRWNSFVELFVQQYGVSREKHLSKTSKKQSSGQERYSPSDLSPRVSPRRSRSREHSRLSSERKKPRASRSGHYSSDNRDSGRRGRSWRSRSRSGSPRWEAAHRRSAWNERTRSPVERRRRSPSPGYRRRLRSTERELNYSPELARRYSPGRRSSPSYMSADDRLPHSRPPGRHRPYRRRSPSGRRSPGGRWSPGGESPHRGRSPHQWHQYTPERDWSYQHDEWDYPGDQERFSPFNERVEFPEMDQPPRGRGRPWWHRGGRRGQGGRGGWGSRGRRGRGHRGSWGGREDKYRSPVKEPEFDFEGGVWPDVDDPWD